MIWRILWAVMIAMGLGAGAALGQSVERGYAPAERAGEQVRWSYLRGGGRVLVNAPLPIPPGERLLVIYATPNGNTIEQTLGAQASEGRDWHFDIQHIAAQVRRLREARDGEAILLAVVEAPGLSWPKYLAEVPQAKPIARAIVTQLREQLSATRVALAGHSGGGALLLAYVDGGEAIDASIERMVFLDANYNYADERHAEKLVTWLRGDADRRLIVMAYDDRQVTLGGKLIVSATGGTYRATERMRAGLQQELKLTRDDYGQFLRYTGAGGQVELLVHRNAENRILHTALVGEMNGLLHGLAWNGVDDPQWGRVGGPRDYSRWVDADPVRAPTIFNERPSLPLPARPKDADSGSQFAPRLEALTSVEREAAIRGEILRGNVPGYLRYLKPISVEAIGGDGKWHWGVYFVTADYLAVGSDDDFLRLPMTPQTAQAIATHCEAALVTVKVSNDVFEHAEQRLEPRPLTNEREKVRTFVQHHQIIEAQRGERKPGLLISGIKKDVVVSNRLAERPERVAIFGWHQADGKPIQPLYVGHVDWYVDYSHGIRLMSRRMIVDGEEREVQGVLRDAAVCGLISDEGPIVKGYD